MVKKPSKMANEKTATENKLTVAKEEVAQPTSEKLTTLQAELQTLWADMVQKPAGSKEALDANLAVYKKQKEIEGEIAAIKKAESDRIIDEQRNARAKMADDLIDKVLAIYNVKRTPAKDAEFAEPRQNVVNELLAKYAASKPSSNGTNATPGASKGATAKAIVEIWEANRAAGMNDTDNVKDIISRGHSRGTTGAVTLAWRREHGEAK